MASSNIVKAKKTSLNGKLTSTALSFTLKELVAGDGSGVKLTMTHFGDWFVAVFKQGSTTEMIKCTGITQNSDGTATVTVDSSGRSIDAIPPYAGSSSGETFNSGAEVIISNDPLTLAQFARLGNANIWEGVQTFNAVPKMTGSATDPQEIPNLSQVQTLATGNSITDRVLVSGTAGEGVSAGQIVYFKVADGKWYLADATDTAKSDVDVKLGVATQNKATGETVTILVYGRYSSFSGLTTGIYYLSDTPGGISTTKGTNKVVLGIAVSATEMLFIPNYNALPTADQKDALTGMSGTPLSSSNRVVDEQYINILVPTGTIVPYGGTTNPSGWVMCDGSAVSRSTYADLFTIIGTTYGAGDGSTTFNLPDMRGRIGVGKNSGTFSALGDTGGEEEHTLTTSEMPSHTHSITGGYGSGSQVALSSSSATGSQDTDATGGGLPHNNLQPYLVLNYIIKT